MRKKRSGRPPLPSPSRHFVYGRAALLIILGCGSTRYTRLRLTDPWFAKLVEPQNLDRTITVRMSDLRAWAKARGVRLNRLPSRAG